MTAATVATQIIEESTPASVEKTVKKQANKDLQKTRLCVYNLEGKCGFGSECMFAHSSNEIRGVPDLRKTQLCMKFMEGNCVDKSCGFAHGEEELRDAPNFKKKLCKWSSKGGCRNGNKCGFAHNAKELRGLPAPPPGFKPIAEPPWRAQKVAPPPGLEKMVYDDGDAASTVAPSSSQVSKSSGDSDCSTTEAPLFRLAADDLPGQIRSL